MNATFSTTISALELAATGAAVSPWLFVIAAVLVIGGALFLFLRGRGSRDADVQGESGASTDTSSDSGPTV